MSSSTTSVIETPKVDGSALIASYNTTINTTIHPNNNLIPHSKRWSHQNDTGEINQSTDTSMQSSENSLSNSLRRRGTRRFSSISVSQITSMMSRKSTFGNLNSNDKRASEQLQPQPPQPPQPTKQHQRKTSEPFVHDEQLSALRLSNEVYRKILDHEREKNKDLSTRVQQLQDKIRNEAQQKELAELRLKQIEYQKHSRESSKDSEKSMYSEYTSPPSLMLTCCDDGASSDSNSKQVPVKFSLNEVEDSDDSSNSSVPLYGMYGRNSVFNQRKVVKDRKLPEVPAKTTQNPRELNSSTKGYEESNIKSGEDSTEDSTEDPAEDPTEGSNNGPHTGDSKYTTDLSNIEAELEHLSKPTMELELEISEQIKDVINTEPQTMAKSDEAQEKHSSNSDHSADILQSQGNIGDLSFYLEDLSDTSLAPIKPYIAAPKEDVSRMGIQGAEGDAKDYRAVSPTLVQSEDEEEKENAFSPCPRSSPNFLSPTTSKGDGKGSSFLSSSAASNNDWNQMPLSKNSNRCSKLANRCSAIIGNKLLEVDLHGVLSENQSVHTLQLSDGESEDQSDDHSMRYIASAISSSDNEGVITRAQPSLYAPTVSCRVPISCEVPVSHKGPTGRVGRTFNSPLGGLKENDGPNSPTATSSYWGPFFGGFEDDKTSYSTGGSKPVYRTYNRTRKRPVLLGRTSVTAYKV